MGVGALAGKYSPYAERARHSYDDRYFQLPCAREAGKLKGLSHPARFGVIITTIVDGSPFQLELVLWLVLN